EAGAIRMSPAPSSTPRAAPPTLLRRLSLVVVAAAAYAIVGGAITLLGWATDLQRLTDWRNDGISMFPNSAVCVVLSGVGLVLNELSGQRGHRLARLLAIAVLAISGLTLLEHITGANLGIDGALFDRTWGQTAATAPMRMGLPASVSLSMIGMA